MTQEQTSLGTNNFSDRSALNDGALNGLDVNDTPTVPTRKQYNT